MKFSCLLAVSFVALAGGCGDATAPSQNVTALYVLESINGEVLPATFSIHPGWIATVSWATVNLDAAGNATIVERRRTETPSSQFERTDARITDYEITGERIEIGPPCPLDAPIDCVPKRIGQITASTLTLSGDLGDPNGVVYLYRLAATDD
jgi:hypothetical protein